MLAQYYIEYVISMNLNKLVRGVAVSEEDQEHTCKYAEADVRRKSVVKKI